MACQTNNRTGRLFFICHLSCYAQLINVIICIDQIASRISLFVCNVQVTNIRNWAERWSWNDSFYLHKWWWSWRRWWWNRRRNVTEPNGSALSVSTIGNQNWITIWTNIALFCTHTRATRMYATCDELDAPNEKSSCQWINHNLKWYNDSHECSGKQHRPHYFIH